MEKRKIAMAQLILICTISCRAKDVEIYVTIERTG